MSPESFVFPPDKIARRVLAKKLAYVVAEGRKAAEADPNYGTGCKCHGDPTNEPNKTFFALGPQGRPYGDVSNACDGGTRANEEHAASYGGHFEWKSRVYVQDKDKPHRRKSGASKRGWLLIRFIPDRPQVVPDEQ
jgi:hypothetical protein